MKTRINYGINRRNPKTGRIEHKNGKAGIKGYFGEHGFHDRVAAHVAATHRGWVLMGYVLPAEKQLEDSVDRGERATMPPYDC